MACIILRVSRCLLCVTAVLGCAVIGQAQPSATAGVFSGMHWRFIGPEGGRFTAVAGVPGDPNTYYAGAAAGGIYKTTDGGIHWQPVFDTQSVMSIGSLAVARSDSNVVWAGTGEGDIRSHISVGQGVYKSTDGGKTWSLLGLEATGRIPRIVVDSQNPDLVFVCAQGHDYGPQQERGVYRTTDGGRSWARTLFVDENTGCTDVAVDPANPQVVFAGMWQVEIHTWGVDSGGPGSGIFVSRDGGSTWKRLSGHGLPERELGKIAVSIAPSNPNRVYALIETGDGVPWKGRPTDTGQVFRSEDGGRNWTVVSHDHAATERPHYFTRMAVAPDNENETYYLTTSLTKSIDGGRTLTVPKSSDGPGVNYHDIWIDPTNANRIIVGHGWGVSITVNRGRTWLRQRLTNAQVHHVATDNAVPYNVLGNRQDGGSYIGPSNSRLAGPDGLGIPRAMWHSVGGGGSGWALPDPANPGKIWATGASSGTVGGEVVRFDEDTRQFRNVAVWPDGRYGPAENLKYRFGWDAPFLVSPHDSKTLYIGSQFLHRSIDAGQSWQVISPDLTLNDRTRMGSSGGLTPDNTGAEYAGVVYAVAESSKERGLIWVGTNDGLVQLTRDGGKTWTNVTTSIPNLPGWGSVRTIAPSRYDAGTAYITVDFHQVNNRDPFVYKTEDYGRSFKAITSGIPRSMLSYAHWICEDPVRQGLLYLGTENGLYVSFDDGANWQPLQNNLPHAPVYGIVVQERFNDMVVATFGRGIWILDDLTPLQQLTPAVLASDVHLFPPRPAYRFRPVTAPATPFDDPTVGENPTYGASLNYYLKAPASADISVTVLDDKGRVVRKLKGSNRAGLNRVYWDLRYESTNEVRLRTRPLYAPWFTVGPEGRRAGDAAILGLLAPPGNYTVKLSVGDHDLTERLSVLLDPNTGATQADIAAQMPVLLEIQNDLNVAANAVNRAELVRSQIDRLAAGDAALARACEELNRKLIAAEMTFVDLRHAGGDDEARYGFPLVWRLYYLGTGLASNDFGPTAQQIELQRVLEDQLHTSTRLIDALLDKDLAGLNEMLRKRGAPSIRVEIR